MSNSPVVVVIETQRAQRDEHPVSATREKRVRKEAYVASEDRPTAAQRVLAYIDYIHDVYVEGRRAPLARSQRRRAEQTEKRKPKRGKRRSQHRRPGTMTVEERRRQFLQPEAQSQEEREQFELNRLMRKKRSEWREEDGVISGPLSVAAHYATPQLLTDFELDEEHTPFFEHWLTAKFGDTLRDPDVAGYFAWREQCRQLASPS